MPETPEAYEFKIDPAWLPEGVKATDVPADDPLLTAARPILHKLGAKQEDFAALTEAFVKWQAKTLPDIAAERAALGEGAGPRIQAVDAWLARALPENLYKRFVDRLSTASDIEALEKLMAVTEGRGAGGAPGGGLPTTAALTGGGPPRMTPAEARAAMGDPAYYKPEGADMRGRVESWLRSGGNIRGA